MLQKTRGIALSFIKYRDTSIIAKIFTEELGMQSYIVNGVRSKAAKTKIALFQPLTLLDLVVYHNKKKEIHRISEIKCSVNFHSIPYDIKKTTIALFLTEFLNQVLRTEVENSPLFNYISDSVEIFDHLESKYENFHLQFLAKLTQFMGIRPESGRDLLMEIGHAKYLDPHLCQSIDQLMEANHQIALQLRRSERMVILQAIIEFYRFHFDSIKEIKSLQVLKEVLS